MDWARHPRILRASSPLSENERIESTHINFHTGSALQEQGPGRKRAYSGAMTKRFWLTLFCLVVCTPLVLAAPKAPRHPAVSGLAVAHNGTLLAVGDSEGTIHLLRVPGYRELRALKGHKDGVTSLVFGPGDVRLYSGSLDRTARVWSVASGQSLAVLGPHSDDVLSVSVSPDAKTLLASSYDGVTVLWDLGTQTRRPGKLPGHTSCFSPKGNYLATASIQGTLHLYTSSGKEVASWKAHGKCPNSLSFSPDGQRLASCAEHVRIWRVPDHSLASDINTQATSVLVDLSWSLDGDHLLSTSFWNGASLLTETSKGWVSKALAIEATWQRGRFLKNQADVVLGNQQGQVGIAHAGGKQASPVWQTAPISGRP